MTYPQFRPKLNVDAEIDAAFFLTELIVVMFAVGKGSGFRLAFRLGWFKGPQANTHARKQKPRNLRRILFNIWGWSFFPLDMKE